MPITFTTWSNNVDLWNSPVGHGLLLLVGFSSTSKAYHRLLDKAYTLTTVSCIQVGLLGASVKDKTAYIWDDGEVVFTATTREHIAIAVGNTLLNPAETANRILHISSVECSMGNILATAKKISGSEDWTVTYCDSAGQIAQAKHDRQHGQTVATREMALGRLALLVNLREECEPNFKRRGVLDNEVLGVPQLLFEVVLRHAFAEERCDPIA